MNWKYLKLIAAAGLLAVNIFFALTLSEIYTSKYYFSHDEITSAITVLGNSGIKVTENQLSGKKFSYPVYSGTALLRQTDEVIKLLLGEDASVSSSEAGVTGESGGERFTFTSPFLFSYLKSGDEILPPSYPPASGYYMMQISRDIKDEFEMVVSGLLGINKSGRQRSPEKADIVLEELYYSKRDDCHIAVFGVTYGGSATDGSVSVKIKGNTAVSAFGVFPFILPDEKLTAHNFDIISILFSEKSFFESSGNEVSVASVETEYRLYVGTGGEYKYIPFCIINYDNTLSRSYNLITGELSE